MKKDIVISYESLTDIFITTLMGPLSYIKSEQISFFYLKQIIKFLEEYVPASIYVQSGYKENGYLNIPMLSSIDDISKYYFSSDDLKNNLANAIKSSTDPFILQNEILKKFNAKIH